MAGGLTPENVGDAIKKVSPYMVDMNSGLEKDLIKHEAKIIKAFEEIKKKGNGYEKILISLVDNTYPKHLCIL